MRIDSEHMNRGQRNKEGQTGRTSNQEIIKIMVNMTARNLRGLEKAQLYGATFREYLNRIHYQNFYNTRAINQSAMISVVKMVPNERENTLNLLWTQGVVLN